MMYGARTMPGQSFDHTRRYQNDIVVYSDSELRSALGAVKRGSRIVIASRIVVSRSIEVKILDDEATVFGVPKPQEIVVTGMGGGRLEAKQGVDPFEFIIFRGEGIQDLIIQDVSFNGFKSIIGMYRILTSVFPPPGSANLSNTVIKNCILNDCSFMVSKDSYGAFPLGPHMSNCKILNNLVFSGLTNNCSLVDGFGALSCVFSNNVCQNNTGDSLDLLDAYDTFICNNIFHGDVRAELYNCTISSNTFLGQAIFASGSYVGYSSSINGNAFKGSTPALDLTSRGYYRVNDNYIKSIQLHSAATPGSIITGNVIDPNNALELILNAEGWISRDNIGYNLGIEMRTPGRISQAGEYLGQTIIDGERYMFEKELNSTGGILQWEALSNDHDATQIANVEFYVPWNRKFVLRTHFVLEDDTNSTESLLVRINSSSTSQPGLLPTAWHEQQSVQVKEFGAPVTLEWYVDCSSDAGWEAGTQHQIFFQVKQSSTFVLGTKMIIKAAQAWGPLTVIAEAVHDDVSVMVPPRP
jgi:hypothetical protein